MRAREWLAEPAPGLSCRDLGGVVNVAIGRPRRTGVWLLAGVSLLGALAVFTWRVAGPADGAVIPFYVDAWTRDGVRVSVVPETATGLVDGDVITGVAGRPLAEWLDRALDPTIDRSMLGAAEVTYTVSRHGVSVDVPIHLEARPIGGILVDYWSAIVFTAVLQLVALYVLWQRPEASAAAALAVAAAGVTGSTLPWLLGLQAADIARGWPFVLYALTAGGVYMLLWPAGALHLPLAMAAGPSGPGRRRLALAYGVPIGAYVVGLAATRLAAPSAAAWVGSWPTLQLVVIIPTIIVGIGLSVRGFKRASPTVRAQIRWAVVGVVVATSVSLGLLLVPELLTGRTVIPWSAVGLVALPLPLGVAAGILRSRLLDIDVVINRTLVYGGATVAILAIYAIAATVLGSVLTIQSGFPASLLATALAALVALPIRDALQRGVNRVMYGDRDEPYRALSRLGRRLEGALDPIEAPEAIARTIAESLRLPWVALRLGPPGMGARIFEHGRRPPSDPIAVPLVYGAEVVGDLLVAPRSAAEPLSTADRSLLEALARQAGAAVRAAGLTLDLVASRERLVAAREEERRRIRRDLHDGLGPTLAAIGMRAEVAADLASRDPAGAERVLAELRSEVNGALGDIRRLVDALRPPALDELGLVGALQAQAGRLGPELALDVTADGLLPELPAAVEVAAYRIAIEAMTNVARHARARRCRVRLTATAEPDADHPSLVVEVVDDGRGLPTRVRPGIGLASMRERAAEVGGTCVVERTAGRGTRVFARLPLDESATVGGA